jgi:hypothetical protein
MAWSTLGAVVAASVYAGIAFFQWRAMRASNEQAKIQWEAEHRPWVGTGDIAFKPPPEFVIFPDNPGNGTELSFEIEAPIKNVGVSPALRVNTSIDLAITEKITAPPQMEEMMDTACGRSPDINSRPVGGVLFPNTPGTVFDQPTATITPLGLTAIHRIWIALCVTYTGTGANEKLHHTKVWVASWPMNENPVEIRRTGRTPTAPAMIYYSVPVTNWVVLKTEAD